MKFLIRLMMKAGLNNYMARQLSRPSGWFGSRLIGRMMNRGNAHLEQTALNLCDLQPGHHVLEIGFGNGKMLSQLCTSVSNGKVYGVDISEDLVTQVSYKLSSQIKGGKLQVHLSGVSDLPLENATIDRIITCNTIYFWPEPLNDSKELLRVLKPGGKLIVGYRTVDEMEQYSFVAQNLNIFRNRYSDNEVSQLLQRAGFSEVKTKVEPYGLAPSHVAVAVK